MPKITPLQNVKKLFGSKDQLVAKVADAVLEGKAMRKEEDVEEKADEQARAKTDKPLRKPKVVETDEELEDNALLGESRWPR